MDGGEGLWKLTNRVGGNRGGRDGGVNERGAGKYQLKKAGRPGQIFEKIVTQNWCYLT